MALDEETLDVYRGILQEYLTDVLYIRKRASEDPTNPATPPGNGEDGYGGPSPTLGGASPDDKDESGNDYVQSSEPTACRLMEPATKFDLAEMQTEVDTVASRIKMLLAVAWDTEIDLEDQILFESAETTERRIYEVLSTFPATNRMLKNFIVQSTENAQTGN